MDNIKVLINEEQIKERILELSKDIRDAYNGESVHIVCILKGGVMFFTELAKALVDLDPTFDFMSCSSYNNNTESSGTVKINKDLDEDIEGKNVLIVEDIIDTGYTLSYVVDMLKTRKPKNIDVCTLLDKPYRREVEVEVRFVGFEIEDRFVVGFGLDNMQKLRSLNYVGYIE